MARLGRVLSAAVIVGAGAALLTATAYAQTPGQSSARGPEAQISRAERPSAGVITGFVLDERGNPVAGARVLATGVTMALAFTDKSGRFQTEALPAGEYIIRAHRSGFMASRREVVRVGASVTTAPQLQMRRLEDTATGTSGSDDTPLPSRPIIAAGFGLPSGETAREAASRGDSKDGHPHSETEWRLRHVKRSILKDQSNAIVLAGNEPGFGDESIFGRAMGGAASFASYATSLFTDYPLTGEVNFLTTSALGTGQSLFAGDGLPRGIAYLSLGAPTPAGDWTVRAAMSEGDLASWIVAGSFVSKAGPSHSYTVGLSYSTQDYKGGNPIALAAMRDGSRNAAELYGFDRWKVTRWFELDYGTR
jgi:hypothetical protein